MPAPVLISTDLDRTLIFSPRAIARLGGDGPASRVEDTGRDSDAELGLAAVRALAALAGQAVICPATSRDLDRLTRLRLPFQFRYAIAANGGVVLADGVPDPRWAARITLLLADAAPAAEVRPVLAGGGATAPPWLVRTAEPDEMCCLSIVDPARIPAAELDEIAARCAGLGWRASLTGRKLYAFPAGFGKEHAAAYVAQRIEQVAGAAPARLAAGDTEHDRPMLAAADLAWIPAGSELAGIQAGDPSLAHAVVTAAPGHAGAAQMARDWLEFCRDPRGQRDLGRLTGREDRAGWGRDRGRAVA
jgi:hypothetical protein